MKNKAATLIVNFILCAVIAAVCAVGFSGGSAVEVSAGDSGPYYSAGDGGRGVSLMFNVYEYTSNVYKILEVLDDCSAKATFFLGGCWADDNVDCVREIAARGHEIGSHGYFHKDHSKMDFKQNCEEISPSVRLLNAITGGEIRLFAPPSGAFSKATLSACSSLGLKAVMWSRDTIDWRDADRSLVVGRATEGIERGEFVLMHPMDVTCAALDEIIATIRAAGLELVTVSQNLGE